MLKCLCGKSSSNSYDVTKVYETIEKRVTVTSLKVTPLEPKETKENGVAKVELRKSEVKPHRDQTEATISVSPQNGYQPITTNDHASINVLESVGDVSIKGTQNKSKAQAPKAPQEKNEKLENSLIRESPESKPPTVEIVTDPTRSSEKIIDVVSNNLAHPTQEDTTKAVNEEEVVEEATLRVKEEKRSDSKSEDPVEDISVEEPRRRSGILPFSVNYDDQPNLPVVPKSPEDEALIKQAIEENDFLNKIISNKRLENVVKAMYKKDVAPRETILKQGEKGSHMYISGKGTFQVLIKNKVVNEFNDVRVFGELAILYNAKRLATIRAITPGKVWVLDRNVYQQIVVRDNIKEQDETMEFLMNNEILKVAGKEALQQVANLLKSEFYKPGTNIVKQGDKGNKFYIIRAGTVTITKDGEGIVGQRKKGDCFGELALLKEDCRQATVTADAPGVECLTLTRKEFIDHFGELKEWEDVKVKPVNSFKDGQAEYGEIDLKDLKMIKTLGVGGFGRVELVQHKKKGDLVFALKYLKKIDIVMQHQEEHVYNEKNIQMGCTSPFIVRLYRTYKDAKYIYFLMESCLGGDLWTLLQKQKLRRFDEKEARFIAGCVLESFEYLHSRGIVYRDLKPENLLIAVNGYIKLTDFGFAKKISSRGKTFTFAGTPEYVAPEIVLNRGHDRAVDYWAFGAFIFELLTGRTPFRTDDSSHMKTYNKILNGIDNVAFPSYVNLKARHIIEKLCRPVPSERLGMQRGGIKDIKAHKWFLGFNWQKFANCEIPSPFKPILKTPIDTRNFDQFKKDTDIPPDELSDWDKYF